MASEIILPQTRVLPNGVRQLGWCAVRARSAYRRIPKVGVHERYFSPYGSLSWGAAFRRPRVKHIYLISFKLGRGV